LDLLEEIGDVEGDVRLHGIAAGVRKDNPVLGWRAIDGKAT
jgi:signal transduction protein with GAF and PtsI domain